MKSAKLMCITAIALFSALAIPVGLAQDNQENNNHHKHHHYKLIDMGTFGGPQSWIFGAFEFPSPVVNNAGTVVGGADTPNSNPNYPNPSPFMFLGAILGYADPFVNQAFEWNNGTLTNLGALPGGVNSFANSISGNGLIAGSSENGVVDPLTGLAEARAVIWKDGRIIDLGTLGGNESFAAQANNRGQVVGFALDASNNTRAFIWTEDQGLQDLGTLGASGAIAGNINERGQISGESALCDTCNQDAFLWEDGKMYRIPDFGGPISFHYDLNDRGQVVGQSDLPGGVYAHPFLWDKKKGVKDLGLLPGGLSASAHWINNAGEAVGISGIQNDQFGHAVLWNHGITDLGTVDGDLCTVAESINSRSQIVGGTFDCNTAAFLHAFLWENGGPMVDLNAVVPPGSSLQLNQADSINDSGEIAGQGTTSNGDNHAFLLIPCDENHGGVEGCDYSRVDTAALPQAPASPGAPSRTSGQPFQLPRARFTFRNRILGRTLAKRGIAGEAAAGQPRFQLNASPQAPIVSLQPASLDFGTVRYSQTKTLTTTLTNVGNATLTISSITITGTDTADFSQTHTCGSKVRAGKHCAITVTFKPIGRYNTQSFSADVSVSDNASGSPQTVPLSGTGYSICHVSCAQCPIRICQCFGPFGGCIATAAKESSRNLLDDPKPAPACANATQSFRPAAPN
jgi:probable HAF family extracellular repeat protein